MRGFAAVLRDDRRHRRLERRYPEGRAGPPGAVPGPMSRRPEPGLSFGPYLGRCRTTGGSDQASVFFVMPTTFDGGSGWNGAIDDARANAYMRRVVLPNYASPFAREAKVSAPLYRQARPLYPPDAARRRARGPGLRLWRCQAGLRSVAAKPSDGTDRDRRGGAGRRNWRPVWSARSCRARPALKARLAAAYLIETLVSREMFDGRIAPCDAADQTGLSGGLDVGAGRR